MNKELWKCNSCGWKSEHTPPYREAPCECCSDLVCPICDSGQIENEFIPMDPSSKVTLTMHSGVDGKEYTFEYEHLYALIEDRLEDLGDTDLYEIRDVILPNIISTIEH